MSSRQAASIAKSAVGGLAFAGLLVLAAFAGWWVRKPPDGSALSARREPTAPAPPEPAAQVEERVGETPAARGEPAAAREPPSLPEHPPPTEEEVRSRVVHALDQTLIQDGPGAGKLLELGPAAVPWAVRALAGEPYAGDKTLEEYVQDLGSDDLDVSIAARHVLIQSGDEAVRALRAVVGDFKTAPRRPGQVGVAIRVGGPPPGLAEVAANVLDNMAPGSGRHHRAACAVHRRLSAIRYLSVHAPVSEPARKALMRYISGSGRFLGRDNPGTWWEHRNVVEAVRGLLLCGAREEDRAFYERLAAGDPKGESGLAGIVYASAALEALGERVDWPRVIELVDTVPVYASDARGRALAALVDAKPDMALVFLLKKLSAPDDPKRSEQVYRALARLGSEKSVGPLRTVALGDDPYEARRAVGALSLIPGDAAWEAVKAALDAPTTRARRAACVALTLRPDEALRGKLERLLEDAAPWTGIAALGALAVLPRPPEAPEAGPAGRLAGRVYALWTSGRPAPEGLEEETNRATQEAWKRPGSVGVGLDALHAMAGRAGIERWARPSSLGSGSLAIRLRIAPDDEHALRWALKKRSNPPTGPWALELCLQLLEMGYPDLLPAALASLCSDHPIVRARAAELLRKVAGGGYGFRHDAPYPERAAAIRKWWSWWAHERTRPEGLWRIGRPPEEDEF